MKHDYSLAHLTVLSLPPPQMIDVAARTGYRYASLRITRVTPADPLYDMGLTPSPSYPIPSAYAGTCGVVAGGGSVAGQPTTAPPSPVTNKAGQVVVSTGC